MHLTRTQSSAKLKKLRNKVTNPPTAANSCTAVTTGMVRRPLVSPWNDASMYLVLLGGFESAVITNRSPLDCPTAATPEVTSATLVKRPFLSKIKLFWSRSESKSSG